jgi:hypothetical protein
MVWNAIGGVIDWQGLPVVAELFGITDIEQLIFDLITIRENQNKGA